MLVSSVEIYLMIIWFLQDLSFTHPKKMYDKKIGKINSSFSKQCIFCLFLDVHVNFIQLIVPQNLEQILIF